MIQDSLASIASPDTQRTAARMAQEVFSECFRQAVSPDNADTRQRHEELKTRCRNWCQAGDGPDAQALRLAMLVTGMDQWGLAYSQAFTLNAIPPLSALIGALRVKLDPQADARFAGFFEQLAQQEADAIDFKITLRRDVHLALWHAMAACETAEQATPILTALGSQMLALDQRMPELGWRLITDTVANMQRRLFDDLDALPFAQEGTQHLLDALKAELPAERYQTILTHAAQILMAWQQSRRPH